METQNNIIRWILQYRNKHHRCRYCLFYKYIYAPVGMGYHKCVLKDIPLADWDFIFWRWQGCFCRWFKAKEDNIDL